jgi:hypothetical protein
VLAKISNRLLPAAPQRTSSQPPQINNQAPRTSNPVPQTSSQVRTKSKTRTTVARYSKKE